MNDAYLDGLLDELVPAEPRDQWNDVRSRARRSQRHYFAVVVAVAALVLAPATWAAVHAFEGTPAPPSVNSSLRIGKLMEEAAKNLAKAAPHVEVSKAHGVLQARTPRGTADLWAAPTSDGKICSEIDWESATHRSLGGLASPCDPARLPDKLEYAWDQHKVPNKTGAGYHLVWRRVRDHAAAGRPRGRHAYLQGVHELAFGMSRVNRYALYGHTYDGARMVEITFGHRTVTLPVVEGFFLKAWNRGEWPAEDALTSVVARNAKGAVVGLSGPLFVRHPSRPRPVPVYRGGRGPLVALGSTWGRALPPRPMWGRRSPSRGRIASRTPATVRSCSTASSCSG